MLAPKSLQKFLFRIPRQPLLKTFSGKYDVDIMKLSWLNESSNRNRVENINIDKRLSAALPSLGVDTWYVTCQGSVTTDQHRGKFSSLTYHITFYRYI